MQRKCVSIFTIHLFDTFYKNISKLFKPNLIKKNLIIGSKKFTIHVTEANFNGKKGI